MPPPRENAYNLGLSLESDKTKNLDAYKCCEFRKKYCKRVAPEVQISGQKSKFLQLWGLYSHISAPTNVKFDTGERTVSPLRGEKFIFGPLSKNNTAMAALRAGLPVA